MEAQTGWQRIHINGTDWAGAELERLEQENARLSAEIERLRAAGATEEGS